MALLDLSDVDLFGSAQFETLEVAQQVLTKSAAQAGFALHLSTSSKQPFVRFHCYKGSKSIKNQPFGTCPCYYRLKRQSDFSYRFGRCDVRHNHGLFPEAFADILLSGELRDYVQELHRIGVPPLKIQLALQARGVRLSCGQVHNICRPGHLRAFEESSAELMNLVRHEGGHVAEYREAFHDTQVRVAVFTQMREENACLSELGDVIELDGTHGPLKTKWEIIPVTVLDRGRHVHCGGIAFAAYVTTDVILWLLQTLLDSCGALSGIWKALITDEDSAFIPAVELFLQSGAVSPDFAHILCAMHKERNFAKKVNRCALAKKDRERAMSLFRQLAYSDHQVYAKDCLAALVALGVPRLTKYIQKHIEPRLPQFAKAFLPAVFLAGLNTTSAAESMNRLLKVGIPGSQSLAAARRWFTQRLNQHDNELRVHKIRRRNVESALEEQMQISLEPEVRKRILAVIDSARDCEVIDREDSYLVHSRRLPDVVYIVEYHDGDGLWRCNCSGMMHNGYPCVHQFAVLICKAQVPNLAYFNPRWLNPEAALPPPDPPAGDDIWNQDDMATDDDIDAINHEDGTQQSLPEVHEWDIDRTIQELPGMSQRSVYLTLFHFAKGICSLAAREHGRSCHFLTVLHHLRMEMMVPSEPQQADGEVQDIRDALARPRGRPKTREIPNASVRAANANTAGGMIISCELCDESHDLSSCPDHDIVLGARIANADVIPGWSQRTCPLCFGYDHQRRTCPCRRRLRARRDEEESPPEDAE
jgi:hypothetical protein